MAAPDVPDWTRVVLLSGIDPSGNPITIAVDASGYIVAIMKGEYAGALKNVAVDSAGRLIMIPTDPADVWGNAISMGNAELAAVLSGARSLDRRGNVIFYDDFEQGLGRVETSLEGTLASVAVSTDESRYGKFSCKLTGGSTDGRVASVEWKVAIRPASKSGAEVFFRRGDNLGYFDLLISYYDGATLHQGGIRYDTAGGKWQYRDSAGNLQDLLTGVNVRATIKLFHYAKLVIDPSSNKYVRALISGQEVAMSTLALRPAIDATGPYLSIKAEVQSLAALNGVAYIDTCVITVNEPA